jgi:predicted dehydrogenase
MGYDLERKPFAIKLKKLLRFSEIYGLKRALVKAAGRLQQPAFRHFALGVFLPKRRHLSIVGCGQFSFSTICYFIYRNHGNVFLDSFDIDQKKQRTLSRFYKFKNEARDFSQLLNNPELTLLYVVSNHASHTDYAVAALEKNIDVYIEKPISISTRQFARLREAIKSSSGRIFAGYNRPYSRAIKSVSNYIRGIEKPISLACFISGHFLDEDHWYRNPEEGSRVCGNLGHWLDLMVHLMNTRGYVPEKYTVSIAYSDVNEPDDNISISIVTDQRDLISITMTSRTEPFEGINETINLQCGNVIAKIDDFRRLIIWRNEEKSEEEYHHKDVGHQVAVNQPFLPREQLRDWAEVEFSTALMLHIAEMVAEKKVNSEFELTFTDRQA